MSPDHDTSAPRRRSFKIDAGRRQLLQDELRRKGLDASWDEIPRRADRDWRPLSSGQRRLWLLDQIEAGGSAYNLPASVRLGGRLDVAALGAAVAEVARRHETLRAAFPALGGAPHQVAAAAAAPLPGWGVADLAGLPDHRAAALALRLAGEAERQPFDLAAGPLLRAWVLRVAADDHILVVVFHHIVADGRSVEIFFGELGALYGALRARRTAAAAAALRQPAIQYCDFAAWQEQQIESGAFAGALAYWQGRLASAPRSLALPADRPGGATARRRAGHLRLRLEPRLRSAATRLAQERQTTLFAVLFAVFAALLERYTGAGDLVVGTLTAGRSRAATRDLIGFFVNTLAPRFDTGGDPAFGELLGRVHRELAGMQAHQDVPFELLVAALRPERRLAGSPLFQVMFSYAATFPLALQELRAATLDQPGAEAKFDLLLAALDHPAHLELVLEYDRERFDAATARRLLAHFEALLGSALQDSAARLSGLAMLGEAERQQTLVEWSGANALPAADAADAAGEADAADVAGEAPADAPRRAAPDEVAVIAGRRQITHGELDRRANQLAHLLHRRGIRAGDAVAVLAGEDAVLGVVAALGIVRSGAAWAPVTLDSLGLGRAAGGGAAPRALVLERGRLAAALAVAPRPAALGDFICLDGRAAAGEGGDAAPRGAGEGGAGPAIWDVEDLGRLPASAPEAAARAAQPACFSPAAAAADLPAHLAPLPGGEWALWRTLVLRGSGFPARQVLALAAPGTAAAAVRILDLESRREEQRTALLAALNGALDDLRREGRWDDAERRKTLVKALQAVTRGKVPADLREPARCAAARTALDAADAALAAARDELARIYRGEAARGSEFLAATARDDRFREAVLWQNRGAVERALDWLIRQPASSARTSRQRQNEELVASYLQRYCTKNDTIGFFGPVGFARLVERGEALTVHCGPGLVEQRTVYFETWCIDTLAEALAADPRLRPWLAPRLHSGLYLEGRTLHTLYGQRRTLSPAEAALLALCDGRRTARELSAELAADPAVPLASEAEVFALLAALRQRRTLSWTLEVPFELHPDRSLAACLRRIEDDELRGAALAALGETQEARDRVALARQSPAALDAALRHLESTFTRLTGAAATHRQGQAYGGRGLVYEDCRRDVRVELGAPVLDRLGPPLALVLRAARWVAGEVARRFEPRLRAAHAEIRARNGGAPVASAALLSHLLPAIPADPAQRPWIAEVEREFHARWAELLDLPGAADARRVRASAALIAPRFDALFGSSHDGPTLGRYLSPDLMIATAGEEAFRRGEFELVLGEMHSGNTLLWSCFLAQHPDLDEVERAVASDCAGDVVVLPQMLKRNWTQRNNLGLELAGCYRIDFVDEQPAERGPRRLPGAAVVVEETAAGLRARTLDGKLDFPAIDLVGLLLNQECGSIIASLLPAAPHQPRLNIDDLVVARERWARPAGELDFAEVDDAAARYLAVRRWARGLGLPRFTFFKTACERKPCYLDLDSPVSTDLFARCIRNARQTAPESAINLSEMLPSLDQTWLKDAAGNLYTSELRLAAVDLAPRPAGAGAAAGAHRP